MTLSQLPFSVEKFPTNLDDFLNLVHDPSFLPLLIITILSLLLFFSYFLSSYKLSSTTNSSHLTSPFTNRTMTSPFRDSYRKIDEILTTFSEFNDCGTILTTADQSHHFSSYDHVIIEPPEKKWLLQSRVANVKTPSDIFSIFDEFDILHKLKLPVRRLHSDISQLIDQAFRDLVRDKININDELVKVDDAIARSPELFRSYFHNRVKEAISDHISDIDKIDRLALYLCCHLSRTRAGGDTLFAVKDIFDSPQLVITASHTDTHPPTDLHVTEDGWAYITTTSNFDVYLHDHLLVDDAESKPLHPLPIATLSATLHEAIVIADKRSDSISRISADISSSPPLWGDLPLPFYRKMSIVCFDPSDPSSSFHGGWTAPVDQYENDIAQLNWDRETVQTDGIVCISSSLSGAAQLCLPVHRPQQPITPSPDLKSALQSELQSHSGSVPSQTIESLPALDSPRDPDTLSTTSIRSHIDEMEFSTGLHPHASTLFNQPRHSKDDLYHIPSGSIHSQYSHPRVESE